MLAKLSADIVICVALYLFQNCHDVTRLKLLCKDINALLKRNGKFKTDYFLLHSQYSKKQENMWKCKTKEHPDAFDIDWEPIIVTRFMEARKYSKLSLQEPGPMTHPYIYSTECIIQHEVKTYIRSLSYYPLFLSPSKVFLQRIQEWELKAAENVFKTFAQKRRFKSLVMEKYNIVYFQLLVPTNSDRVNIWTEERKKVDIPFNFNLESILQKGQKILFVGEVSGFLTEDECGFRIYAKHIMIVPDNYLCKRHCF